MIVLNQKQINDLKRTIEVQKQEGNWNYNPYMFGLLNGMILVESIIENKEPVYFDAPDEFLADLGVTVPTSLIVPTTH